MTRFLRELALWVVAELVTTAIITQARRSELGAALFGGAP